MCTLKIETCLNGSDNDVLQQASTVDLDFVHSLRYLLKPDEITKLMTEITF